MGQTSFTLISNQVLTNTSITGNGKFTIYTSPTQSNPGGFQSLRLVVEYDAVTPPDPGPVGISYALSLIVESPTGANWFPIAYQFEDYRSSDNGKKRIIILQPNMSTFDSGIDDIVYIGGTTEARISRQQGKVGNSFRVRLICQENGFGGAGAFQSAVLNIYGDLYDA